MAFHRQEYEKALIADGMSPQEARNATLRQFGNAARFKEESVETVGFRLETAWQDLRYAVRQLRKNPGFAFTAILILALGIGATTAIFSALNPILFESLPYPQSGQLMMIWDMFQGNRLDVTFHTYRELAERNRTFEALAVMRPWQPTMTSADEPERFDGQWVSWKFFRVLGIMPKLGRDFQESDDRLHGPNVVILSDGLWRRRFAADPGILGTQITLDGDSYIVIGVMPPGFENIVSPSAHIWRPLQYDSGNMSDLNTREWGHHLRLIGRLKPEENLDQARRDVDLIASTRLPEFPRPAWASVRSGFIVDSLQHDVTRGVKPALLAVLGAVVLVLLIASVNVTNLLLARGGQRRGEFAVRAALGAGQSRLLRQLLTESLLIAVLGGIMALGVAAFGIRALVALSPTELPRLGAIHLDGAVFIFALIVTTLVGLLVGLVPGFQASRNDPLSGLQQGSQRTSGSHQRTRRTLVVAEVALALVLLVSAGLIFRSLERLFGVNPGFDTSHLLTMEVQESGHRYHDSAAAARFFQQSLEAVRAVPGVSTASFTSLLPLSDDRFGNYGVAFEGDPPGTATNTFRYAVLPGYFETMGIPLRRGRLLDLHDTANAPPAVVVSEALAKTKFGAQDPIGKRVHIGPLDRPWFTIVGVVADVKQTSLILSDPNAVYITAAQSWFVDNPMSLVVRTSGDPASLTPAIRQAIWSVDKDQPIVRVATMDDLVASLASQRHFALVLFAVFAVVALILAATGIYGVLSSSVTERTREMGVRAALGASRNDIVGLVLRQGMTLAAVGIVIGLAGAALASRGIMSLLFGVSRLDPVTYTGVIVTLLVVAAMACWIPAWRAARVDPSITLRAE